MNMRLLTGFFAASLCVGLAAPAFAGGGNPRIDGDFIVTDDLDGNNSADVEIDGTDFSIGGSVFSSTGTLGDDVTIFFATPQPSSASASDTKGAVRQKRFSELTFVIDSADDARDLNQTIVAEKCDVNGSVNMDAGTGKVTVKCQGDNIYGIITADQKASITAAFQDNTRVKFKVNEDGSKGSLAITIKGAASED
jgi:hypothetical protein